MDIIVKSENDKSTASNEPPVPPAAGDTIAPATQPTADKTPSTEPTQPIDTDKASTPPDQPPAETPAAAPIAPQSTPPRKKKSLVALIIILLVLLAGGAAAYFMLHKTAKPVTQQSTETKKDIALIRYGQTDNPTNIFYPEQTTDNTSYDINYQIFEGLVQYKDKSKIVPLLATSWENPDTTTWLFTLKSGVTFHTGRPMTAKDVKYSLENFKDSPLGGVFNTTIKSVDVLSDNKVKITTVGPDPLLLNRLVFLPILDSQSTAKNDPVNGTGPYVVKPGSKPSAAETDLVAFDKWHGGHVYTRELDYKYYTDVDKLINDRKDGKIDIAGNFTGATEADPLSINSTLDARKSIGTYYMGINSAEKGSPLANLKVRQAVYYATDVPALLATPHYKSTHPVEPSSQIVGQGIPGYDSTIKPYAHDAAKAKQLLAEAGYPKGITLGLTYYAPVRQDVADEFKRQFAEAGITLKLNGISDGATLDATMYGGKSQLWFASYTSDLIDLTDVVAQIFQGKNYDNKTVDDLQTQASQTFDQAKRLSILQQESRTLMNDVAWIPLFPSTLTWAYDPGFVIHVDRPNDTFGVNFATVYRK